jgi:hypothetical protein
VDPRLQDRELDVGSAHADRRPPGDDAVRADSPPSPRGLGLAETHRAGYRPIIGIAPPGMNSFWSYFWHRSAGYNSFEALAPTPLAHEHQCGQPATTQATRRSRDFAGFAAAPTSIVASTRAVPGRPACVPSLTGTSSACTGASRRSRPSATATSRRAARGPKSHRGTLDKSTGNHVSFKGTNMED